MSGSIVKKCACNNVYQDNVYGKTMRVFNFLASSSKGDRKARCTVCGNVTSVSGISEDVKSN
jgi:hypothetical protein